MGDPGVRHVAEAVMQDGAGDRVTQDDHRDVGRDGREREDRRGSPADEITPSADQQAPLVQEDGRCDEGTAQGGDQHVDLEGEAVEQPRHRSECGREDPGTGTERGHPLRLAQTRGGCSLQDGTVTTRTGTAAGGGQTTRIVRNPGHEPKSRQSRMVGTGRMNGAPMANDGKRREPPSPRAASSRRIRSRAPAGWLRNRLLPVIGPRSDRETFGGLRGPDTTTRHRERVRRTLRA